MRLTKRFHD